MQITIYGIIIFGYIALIFLKIRNTKKRFLKIFILSVFLYTNITIGFVVKVGNQTIAGYFITTLVAAIAALPMLSKMELNRFIQMILFIIVIGLSLFLIPYMDYTIIDQHGWDSFLFGANNLAICKINSTHMKELVKAVSFIIILETIHRCMTKEDWKTVIDTVIRWSKIVIIYGVFEFIAVYILNIYDLYTIILQPIFGVKESTYTYAYSRGSGRQLQCLFTEPSVYASELFLIILMFIAQYRLNKSTGVKTDKKGTIIWVTVCIFLEFFSMSFSAILYLTVLALVFVVYLYKTQFKYRPIIIGLILITTLFTISGNIGLISSDSYQGGRLLNAITILKLAIADTDLGNLYFHVVNQANDGSTISRIGSVIGSIRIEFTQNPFIGLGVGTANAYGLLSNMLTDLGVLGTVLWIKMVVFDKKEIYNKYFILALLVTVFMCSLNVPFNYLGTDALLFVFLLKAIFDVRQDTGKSRLVFYTI